MLGLQSRDHAKKRKENTSWSQATFVYFRAMPPRHLTPALVTCRCRPPPLRVAAPSADYEYLMFLGARHSCGQLAENTARMARDLELARGAMTKRAKQKVNAKILSRKKLGIVNIE